MSLSNYELFISHLESLDPYKRIYPIKVSQITKLLNCDNKEAKELIINVINNFNY